MEDFLIELRHVNIKRQEEYPKPEGVELDENFRSNELMGEAGELAGCVKKLYRERMGIAGNKHTKEELRKNLEEEMGDVLICLDLLASFYGVDLEAVTRKKFNEVSDKVGVSVYI